MRKTVQQLFQRSALVRCATFNQPTPCNLLTEEEIMLQTSVREFANTVVKPRSLAMDDAAKMEPIVIQEVKAGIMSIKYRLSSGSSMSFFSSILAIGARSY